MYLDEGKMEKMFQEHLNSPCIGCEHLIIDGFEFKCPLFRYNEIPNDILIGEHKHRKPHPEQISEGLFKEKYLIHDK